jgi:hypothetical protein
LDGSLWEIRPSPHSPDDPGWVRIVEALALSTTEPSLYGKPVIFKSYSIL